MSRFRWCSTGFTVAMGYMSRDEALFWLGLSITVLQAIFEFYKWYTDPARAPAPAKPQKEGAKA